MSDPRTLIEDHPMGSRRWCIVLIMTAISAVDGFDVLSIALAAPGITHEWGMTQKTLGLLLSVELIGMGFGSTLFGNAADRFGRRPMILICLSIITTAMGLTAGAQGPEILALWRFATGVGIGGMLSAINSVTAEISNEQARPMAMAIMVNGYPLGCLLGGLVAALVLGSAAWRSIFWIGAFSTATLLPLVLLFVPETPDYHLTRSRADALRRVNRSLRGLGLPLATAIHRATPSAVATGATKPRFGALFAPSLVRTTVVLTFAFAAHMMTSYYLLKWTPKIIVDHGYSEAAAAAMLGWVNLGGVLGGWAFGLLMRRFGLTNPTVAMLVASATSIVVFGHGGGSNAWSWRAILFIAGMSSSAAMVGFYSLFAYHYPSHVRATGTGFTIGAGRVGAAASPMLAGLLFATLPKGSGQVVALVMACGSAFAALALMLEGVGIRNAGLGKPIDASRLPLDANA